MPRQYLKTHQQKIKTRQLSVRIADKVQSQQRKVPTRALTQHDLKVQRPSCPKCLFLGYRAYPTAKGKLHFMCDQCGHQWDTLTNDVGTLYSDSALNQGDF
jgi:hypothetical protein